MKTFPSQKGPFQERPFFEKQEIELLCQEELKKVGLLPSNPEPIRIERFVEKRFRVTPIYDELPPGVLGFTNFGPDGVEAITVSRALLEDGTKISEKRINTTLAHEAGHGLLHSHLFVMGAQPEQLFGDDYDPKTPKILCRDENVGSLPQQGYDGRWWEFHANQAIGALLLPKNLAELALASILKPAGIFGLPQLKSSDREEAAKVLSDLFNVNPAAAKIRLNQLFPARDSKQMTF